MAGNLSSSYSSAPISEGNVNVLPISEGNRRILKAHYEDIVKVCQTGLLKTLSFVLENGEVVMAEGLVMSRYCNGIDSGIESINVPVGVSKDAVEYFIKTVYLREEAIRTIPPTLFKDVVVLAFTYDAVDWEDHLPTSDENLAAIWEIMEGIESVSVVRKKAGGYLRSKYYNRSIPAVGNNEPAAVGCSSGGSTPLSDPKKRSHPINDHNKKEGSLEAKRKGGLCGSSNPHVIAGNNLSREMMNAKPGETINILPGTYEMKKLVLNLPPGVEIRGSDMEKTIIKGSPGNTVIWQIKSGSGKNVLIENITFEMDGIFGSTKHRSGLILLSPGSTVRGCTFISCCLTYEKQSQGSLCVDSNFINSQWGIYFYEGSGNTQVKDCSFEKVKCGLEVCGKFEQKFDGLKFENVEVGVIISGQRVGVSYSI